MADPIPLHSDKHQQVQELLPWYCTGKIDPSDRAKVDAHLAECAACQAELRVETRLSEAVAALPLEIELGWSGVRRRLHLRPSPSERCRTMLIKLWRGLESGDYVRWAVAAQIAALLLLVTLVSTPDKMAEFHALSSQDSRPAGNLIVMFRPETAESVLRHSLSSAGARLVDGPTPAGAYVLYVAPDHVRAALTSLRTENAILMAEPLDESLTQ